MALASVNYTGDGATTNFTIPFDYVQPSDINITVAGVGVSFTFLTSTVAQIVPAPANGATVTITRVTVKASRLVAFQDGSTLAMGDLNLDSKQAFYALQEIFDALTALGTNPLAIVDGSVTTPKLAAGAVTAAKIANGSVATVGLADASVTTAKIVDANVTTSKLAANAVTDANIQSGGLSTASIANNAVDNTKIRDSGACSVIGRSANSSGDPADISAGSDGGFLSRHSGAVAFAAIVAGDLPAATNAAQGITQYATEVEQETATATNRAVCSAAQQWHPSAAKAWGMVTPATTVNAGFNISSISRTSAGVFVVNFTTAFSSANYAVLATVNGPASGSWSAVVASQSTGSVTLNILNTASHTSDPTLLDPTSFYFVCFGDQ